MKRYIYNFNGETYETNEPFDETYKVKKAEALAKEKPFSRQVIDGDKIINQQYHPAGIWLDK